MDLKDYLKDHQIKINDLAKKLGIARNHLSGVVNKRYIPSYSLAKAIEKFTNRNVLVDDLIPPKEEAKYCPCCKQKLPKGVVLSENLEKLDCTEE